MRLEFVIAGALGAVLAFAIQLAVELSDRRASGDGPGAGQPAGGRAVPGRRRSPANPRITLVRDTLAVIAVGSFGMAIVTASAGEPTAAALAVSATESDRGVVLRASPWAPQVDVTAEPSWIDRPTAAPPGVASGEPAEPPAAAFTVWITVDGTPLAVTFRDPAGRTTTRDWDFSDGPSRPTLVSTHTFVDRSYAVTVEARDAPLDVTFLDASVGPVFSRSWDFGDGGTSSGSVATHTFASGEHIVTLTVVGAAGKASTTMRFEVGESQTSTDGVGLTSSN